jgi:glycosyltransferase involved in cell wall biosynthesis
VSFIYPITQLRAILQQNNFSGTFFRSILNTDYMRILVLSKRQYSGYDFLDHRFGRLRELPLELARLGHSVVGVTLSYRHKSEHNVVDNDPKKDGTVTWYSINLTQSYVPRPDRYVMRAIDIAQEFRPDLIWACSDAYHAIFGSRLAQRFGISCVIDLYDNFESFKTTWVPGVLPLFKRAIRSVHGVTCVSHSLANYISQTYGRQGPYLVLENSVRADLFFTRDQKTCRKQLGLPEEATIIGTAGALDSSRGVKALFGAFDLLRKNNPTLRLTLAGPRNHSCQIPIEPAILDLGSLPLETVPLLFNALDVAVICNRDSTFGRYCFPQKAYEIIACRVPLVAADVGSMQELLNDYPQCLYEPENPASLAQAIEQQLDARTIVNIAAPSWADSARKLEAFFQEVLANPASRTEEPSRLTV